MLDLQPKVKLSLRVEDQDTANQVSILINVFEDDKKEVVKHTVAAALSALEQMGFIEHDEVSLHTRIKRR